MAQRRGNLFGGEVPGPDDHRAGGGIGALLKRRREETQQDIDEVSRQLRIRVVYIRAIEEGRFHELPGNAYAVGFVRAYADYLGLDGGSIVGDYRDELARRSRQNDLVWPSEGSESRFPGGAILVVCVLLGLVIYGGWYYATQSGGTGIKLIDQVPEYIKKATGVGQTANNGAPANAIGEAPSTTNAAANAAAGESTAPSTAGSQANSQANSQIGNTPVPLNQATAANPPPAQLPGAAASTTNSQPVTGAQSTANPPPAVVAAPVDNAPAATVLGQGTTTPSPDNPAPDNSTPHNSTPDNSTPGVSAPAPDTTSAAATPSPEPSAIPAAPAPPAAKVVIRANRDSWIEIRDQNEGLVVQKVLRQGETYNVPDQKGLIMTTGNAGGIVIELEGKPLQSFGSLGVVKRGIKLDPAALADGSAFNTDDDQ